MQILINALKKYKIVSPEIPEVLPSPQLIYYRNKIEYAFSAYGFSNENNSEDIKPVLGFHPINRPEQVLEIEECYLQKQPSRDICESLHQFAMQHGYKYYNAIDNTGFLKSLTIRTSTTGDLMAIICFSKDYETPRDKILDFLKHHFPEITSLYYSIQNIGAKGFRDDLYFHYSGNSTITEKIDEVKFQISSGSFFQLNPFQAVNLYRKIKEFARLDSNEFAYDLYTGTGSIACYLAKDAGRIMGIEGSACAIADAKINAEINGFYNLEFLTGDILETFKPEFIARHGKPDVIILDPPRSGTLIEIKKTILHAAPSRIVYVSCNPVSLAWDLKQLCENYHIVAIQPFDMFPHTHHLETVVLLEPK
jgi:23S rRNA (uracil1939-C5)-methyltransferase